MNDDVYDLAFGIRISIYVYMTLSIALGTSGWNDGVGGAQNTFEKDMAHVIARGKNHQQLSADWDVLYERIQAVDGTDRFGLT